jgi:hypothetical protein
MSWRVNSPLTVLYGRNDEAGTPSIANSKPQPAWRAIRQWLETMQLIAAASRVWLPRPAPVAAVLSPFKDAEHLALIDDSILTQTIITSRQSDGGITSS